MKRGDKCSLVPRDSTSESSSPASPSHSQSKPQDDAFTLADVKLFYRFTTTTCRYVANPQESSPWLDKIPALATEHPFLMHELMALAAVDLSNVPGTDPAAVAAYESLARRHHAQALAGLMPAITSQRAELVAPVWSCNSLLAPYYFATTTDPASLLFTTDPPGPAEWMLPLRGAVTLFKTHYDALFRGPIGDHLRPYRDIAFEAKRDSQRGNPSEVHVLRLVDELRRHGDIMMAEERDAMTRTLEILRECFVMSDRGDEIGQKTASLTFCASVPGAFFELLGRKKRAALVVMTFWCLLLHRADQGRWWVHVNFKKVRDLLGYIVGFLDPEARKFVRWPVEEMGEKLEQL